MEFLPPVGWADVATKRDLDALAVATKRDLDALAVATRRDLDALGDRLTARFERGLRLQTWAIVGGLPVIGTILYTVAHAA